MNLKGSPNARNVEDEASNINITPELFNSLKPKLDLEKYYIEELRLLVKGNRELQDKFYKDEDNK